MLRVIFTVLLGSLLLGLSFNSMVLQAQSAIPDPILEKRLTFLSEQLRCLVCQNQNIADSQAELAIDLKNQVREKLQQGMSDQDVLDFMVQRYGDFVLYNPPVKATTWILWFGPVLLLLGGMFTLFSLLKRRRLSNEIVLDVDLQRGAQLLDADENFDADPKEIR
ncbi:cytochrome c-type biogenesis protein [Undibacterium sp.]|uniref:cytochrome c-type biogenesis protein n=1 Tax=Undibacterium sp. TaxID=1914977 RepID=UPI0037537BA1